LVDQKEKSMKTTYRFGLFVVVALIQLYFPGKMVFDSNKVMWLGTAFKFETRPVDPADPFRGRYVALNFTASQFNLDTNAQHSWKKNDPVFVLIGQDGNGYAEIKGLSHTAPTQDTPFIKARVSYVWENELTIYYPFSKFFMEENKAPEAERIYRRANAGYALVHVYQGNAVLSDVFVKGKSLRELAK
jgi:uncharacterized membrane-anchored protein